MQITEIRVHLRNEGKLKAFATVTFDSCFVVRNMKIVQGSKGLILCMPSRKMPDGQFKDVAHPISSSFRKVLEEHIMGAYQEELRRTGRTPSRSSAQLSGSAATRDASTPSDSGAGAPGGSDTRPASSSSPAPSGGAPSSQSSGKKDAAAPSKEAAPEAGEKPPSQDA